MKTKVKGIDISKWQGDIDFAKVQKDGIEFAILRSSFRHTTDSKFFDYVKGLNEVNIPIVGVYHFSYALSVAQATSEAKYCIEQVEAAGLDKSTIIFFDFEYDTVKKAKESGVVLKPSDCVAHAAAFCEYVEKQGYPAGIYLNLDYYKNWYTKDILKKYIIWLADYSGDPNYDCHVHQYTSSGKVDGITGNVDLDYLEVDLGTEDQNESNSDKPVRSRAEVVNKARSWLGKNEADGSFKEIIDIYNTYLPHPRGVKMNYTTAWCACFWSAVAVALDYTDIMPVEISCGELINLAKKMDIWQENDAYIPNPGDAILFDWNDSGNGDNNSWPDHIGIVEDVSEGYIRTIEGNYNNSVKRRSISLNGKYIRGFITPNYTDDTVPEKQPETGTKTVHELALEVILGDWGNGEERKARLTEAGYNYEEVQAEVNMILNGNVTLVDPDTNQNQPTKSKVTATCYATKFNKNLAGVYKTSANLYLRNDAGSNKKALVLIPKDTEVRCYGYYNSFNGTKWLYIQVVLNQVLYTGFSCSRYLKKK